MDLSPADYVLRALPQSTIEFPIITFSLVGIIGAVLAYATIFSEDGKEAASDGIDFNDFGIEDLGFSDPPKSEDSNSYSSSYGTSDSDKDDSYGFGFGEADNKNDAEYDPYKNTRGGRKSKRRKRTGGCSTSSRRKKSA